MGQINVSVRIPDASDFESAVKAAQEVGLHVTHRFDTLGVVTGSIEETAFNSLRQVIGVGSVEREREYETPRPAPCPNT